MRIEYEGASAGQRCRAALDRADAGVPVLDRRGKRSGLKGCRHPIALRRRHATLEHQRFGAAADPAEERAHRDLVRGWIAKRLDTELTPTRGRHPEPPRPLAPHRAAT